MWKTARSANIHVRSSPGPSKVPSYFLIVIEVVWTFMKFKICLYFWVVFGPWRGSVASYTTDERAKNGQKERWRLNVEDFKHQIKSSSEKFRRLHSMLPGMTSSCREFLAAPFLLYICRKEIVKPMTVMAITFSFLPFKTMEIWNSTIEQRNWTCLAASPSLQRSCVEGKGGLYAFRHATAEADGYHPWLSLFGGYVSALYICDLLADTLTNSAQPGQAACPWWASTLPQLGRIDVRQMPQNFISSHQQTIQTIQNTHLVANSLYVNALRRKPDDLTVLTVFFKYHIYGELGVNSHPPNQPHPWT